TKPPVMIQPVSTAARVMMIGLSSQTVQAIPMSVLAQWTIKPKLLGVPGVANVSIWGERKRQLQVQADPRRIQTHAVTQERLVTSTGDSLWVSFLGFLKASVPGTGGWIDAPQQRLEVRHVLPVSAARDLGHVSVDGSPGLQIGDVAQVVEEHPPLIGDALVNGGPGLILVIEKFPWASTPGVTRELESALAVLRLGMPGVTIDHRIFHPATFIETSVRTQRIALALGAVLLVLGLAALVARWRLIAIAITALVSAVLTAVLVLHIQGAAVNMMVLAGFMAALAVLIDDALADGDAIVRRWQQRHPEESKFDAIRDAVSVRRSSLLYATLILMAAVSPVLFIGGQTGAFFAPMVWSYVLALAAGLAVGLTVTPALAMALLNDRTMARGSSSAPIGRMGSAYRSTLEQVVATPRRVVWGAVATAVGGLALWFLMPGPFLPALKERTLQVVWTAKAGASHQETVRVTRQIADELRSENGVLGVNAHVGRAVDGDQVVRIGSGQIWVSLDPKVDYDQAAAAIDRIVYGYPGIDYTVGTYLQGRLSAALTGSDKPVVVRVFGPDRDVLRRLAEDFRQALQRFNGLVDLQVQVQPDEPELRIKVDVEAAGRAGLKPGDVRRAASMVFAGLEVGKIFESQKIFDVMVWSTPEVRNSVTSVESLLLETPSGRPVRLGDVAEISLKSGPSVIRHAGLSPYLDITADVSGRDVGSVLREVERRVAAIKLPVEYYAEMAGASAEWQANLYRLLLGIGLAALAVLLLLHAAFASWRLALGLLIVLPAAVLGSILPMPIVGSSLGALVGVLAVLGLAVRNGLVLIRHYRQIDDAAPAATAEDVVLSGAADRFAPVVATAGAAGLAILPLLVLGDGPGLEIAFPMAVVMLGGLLTATLFSLFVVPTLYHGFAKARRATRA
ncbi:MAG: efflux RND transporter permease subunit, partial [Hyphomicrobiaceae bacterium]